MGYRDINKLRDYRNQRIRLLIALNEPINVPEIFKSREK